MIEHFSLEALIIGRHPRRLERLPHKTGETIHIRFHRLNAFERSGQPLPHRSRLPGPFIVFVLQ